MKLIFTDMCIVKYRGRDTRHIKLGCSTNMLRYRSFCPVPSITTSQLMAGRSFLHIQYGVGLVVERLIAESVADPGSRRGATPNTATFQKICMLK